MTLACLLGLVISLHEDEEMMFCAAKSEVYFHA